MTGETKSVHRGPAAYGLGASRLYDPERRANLTLAGCCYVMRHGMKVQIVTLYCVSHLQRYGVTVRGNVTNVYLPSRDTL
jgi:hypothetical protein